MPTRGAYLRFDIERLLVETTQSAMRNYFALFYLLVSREALAAIGDTPLMQQLEEESYKNAYAVTQDLKRGVVAAVEALANEAIWYIKHTPDNKFHDQDETDDNFGFHLSFIVHFLCGESSRPRYLANQRPNLSARLFLGDVA